MIKTVSHPGMTEMEKPVPFMLKAAERQHLKYLADDSAVEARTLFFKLTFIFKDFIYLFILERGEGREKKRDRNINV